MRQLEGTDRLFISWTWIMWFVTIGSSLFMILWIMVYSAFESIDFNNEFILLFSTVDFLATLVLTVMIALGECEPSRSNCHLR